jgi:ABC-type multidrug transport system ATPase subunit
MIKTNNSQAFWRDYRRARRVSGRARGEVFGFWGPNGAGKTTTVRMLSALIGPSRGRPSVNGFDVVREPMQVGARWACSPRRPACTTG